MGVSLVPGTAGQQHGRQGTLCSARVVGRPTIVGKPAAVHAVRCVRERSPTGRCMVVLASLGLTGWAWLRGLDWLWHAVSTRTSVVLWYASSQRWKDRKHRHRLADLWIAVTDLRTLRSSPWVCPSSPVDLLPTKWRCCLKVCSLRDFDFLLPTSRLLQLTHIPGTHGAAYDADGDGTEPNVRTGLRPGS